MFFELYKNIISKEVLENTFFINFDDIEDDIIKLEKINKEDIMKNIHHVCIKNLRNYLLNTQEYFKKCNDVLRLNDLNFYLLEYSYENLYLYLYLKLSDNNKTISLHRAFKKYDNNCNQKIDLRNFKRKFERFNDNNDNLIDKNLFFYETDNKYNIYDKLSNVFIHTVNYWTICGYNNSNMNKKNIYDLDEDFILDFIMLNNIDIADIYYFERIFNINFKFYLYREISNMEKLNVYFDENKILKLIKIFNNIIYLPNVFCNVELMLRIIGIYIDNYKNIDIDEFEKYIIELCNDLLEYFLPLYNSLFLHILDKYNDFTKDNIDNNIKEIVENEYLKNTIYNKSFDNNKCMSEIREYHEKIINIDDINNNLYYLCSESIICYFNFNKLKKENIISNLNIFNENIFKLLIDSKQYQISLKEFILKINRLNSVY